MNHDEPIAHVSEEGRCHPLYEHLTGTAKIASNMAKEFGCPRWGHLAGLWHDLGKCSKDFQQMIRAASGLDAHVETKPGRVDHSTAGGIFAVEKFGKIGRILAYIIAGHHSGLPDWQSETSGMTDLAHRILKVELLQKLKSSNPPAEILNYNIPEEKPKQGSDPALWIRLLFSCLVDADFLDTAAFFYSEKSEARGGYPPLTDLLQKFSNYMKDKQARADDTPVNHQRALILRQCIYKATHQPAIFTLTVPTGGGKTLSSLGFALHHAVKFEKRRIIYVIPYTSIIEQIADQFREIFGGIVVEHHSNLEVSDETKETCRSRLACEK